MTTRTAPSFEQLFSAYHWQPIPNCPGRFSLTGARRDLAPEALLGEAAAIREFRSEAARDPVLVAVLPGGGLLSYRRADGSFHHTLNDTGGLARKLKQLGIAW